MRDVWLLKLTNQQASRSNKSSHEKKQQKSWGTAMVGPIRVRGTQGVGNDQWIVGFCTSNYQDMYQMYTNIYVIYTLPETNGWHVLTDGISRRKKFSWPTVNQFSGAKIFVCFREVIHIILFVLYCFFFRRLYHYHLPAPSKGFQLNPAGWWIDTL